MHRLPRDRELISTPRRISFKPSLFVNSSATKVVGLFRRCGKCQASEGERLEYSRQLPHMPDTHLIPTRSPTWIDEFSAPGPSLTTIPTPSWPPIWPCGVGKGRDAHLWVMISSAFALSCHGLVLFRRLCLATLTPRASSVEAKR